MTSKAFEKMNVFSCICSNIIIILLATTNNQFGFIIFPPSTLTAKIQTTLWFDQSIYQCDVLATTSSVPIIPIPYLCNISSTTLVDQYSNSCHLPEYKIMISFQSLTGSDVLTVDDVIMYDSNGNSYTARQFCIPDNVEVPTTYKITENVCNSHYSTYSALCIGDQCKSSTQIVYFDMDKKNGISYNATWADGTNISPVAYTCSPTDNPTVMPTENPTIFPSFHPTKVPTFSPSDDPSISPTTNNPTKLPTYIPTNPPTTALPTSVPTDSPSNIPSRHPTISPSDYPTNNPSFNPSETPSDSPSKHPTTHTPTLGINNPTFAPTMIISTFIPTSGPLVMYTTDVTDSGSAEKISHSSMSNGRKVTISMIVMLIAVCICCVIVIYYKKCRKLKHGDNDHDMMDNDDYYVELGDIDENDRYDITKVLPQNEGLINTKGNDIDILSNIKSVNSEGVDYDSDDDIYAESGATNRNNTFKHSTTSTIGSVKKTHTIDTNSNSQVTMDGDIDGDDDIQTAKGHNQKNTSGQFKQILGDNVAGTDLLMDDIINDVDTNK